MIATTRNGGAGGVPHPGGEPLGELLARVRRASGRTQLRVAEALCAAAGWPTVTRHEVARWERGTRIPAGYWLAHLAVVLEVDLAELERAAARSRGARVSDAGNPEGTQ